MIRIKRYPNRKLYNTETKQYITLETLADLIREGEEIQVVDTSSGADLTVLTLTQVLFEQAKKQAGFLPHSLLSGLIRAGGQQVSYLQKSLAATLGRGRQVDEEIQRRVQTLIERGDLGEQEGLSLLDKLLRRDDLESDSQSPDADFVTRILEKRGMASRSQMQKLLEQVEKLTQTVDELTQKEEQPVEAANSDEQSAR